jgi:prepilin-type N-terminal cleavage/methylation domain-containing protein
MRKTRLVRDAFTLVELLVVIGIIALLIAILMPALSKARQQSYSVKCGAQLRGIGQSIMIYATANKGYIYPAVNDGQHIGSTVAEDKRWPTYIFDDLMKNGTLNASNHFSPEFLRCPVDDRDVIDGGDQDPNGSYHSYNYNCALLPAPKGTPPVSQLDQWVKLGHKVPGYDVSEVVVLVEKRQNLHDWHIDVREGNIAGTKQQWYQVLFNQDPTDPGLPDNPRANNKPKYKHGKMGNNYLYLDFSVRNEEPRMKNPATQGAPHNYFYK